MIAQRLLLGSSAAWLANRRFVIDTYAQSSSELWDDWLELLRPAAAELEPLMLQRLVDVADAESSALAWGLVKLGTDMAATRTRFADQLIVAGPSQFAAILSAVERAGHTAEFSQVVAQRLTTETDDWARAVGSVALARLGSLDPLRQRFSHDSQSPETILAVSAAVPGRLRVYDLQQVYALNDDPILAPAHLRRSLLLALAQQAGSVADDATKNWLGKVSAEHLVRDPDACCFSAAELIRRRLGYADIAPFRQKRRELSDDRGVFGNVLIDKTGLAFSLIDVASAEGPVRLAVCMHELTCGEMQKFLGKMDEADPIYGAALEQDRALVARALRSDHPFQCDNRIRDLRLVYRYCNWLSQENGVAADAWAYPQDLTEGLVNDAMVQRRPGSFRLLTSQEWLQAGAAAEALSGLLTNQLPVIHDYAWSIENSGVVVQPVATRLPDNAGLFDMFGNVGEICHAPTVTVARFVDLGNTVRAQYSSLRNQPTGRVNVYLPAMQISNLHTGFRVAYVVP
jgi:hypothetical protein